MIRGRCLCGAVRFEIEAFVGPFELCHCNRCRKASGSAFVSGIGVRGRDFCWLSGVDEISRYEAPVVERPPGYQTAFCRRCGSPLPTHVEGDTWLEVWAGLLDEDPGIRPDRHIFIECGSSWYAIRDELPKLTKRDVIRMRLSEIESRSGRAEGSH
jgi:hypothetical protein